MNIFHTLVGWSVSKSDTNGVFESALEGDLEADQNLTRVGRAAPLLFLLDRSDGSGELGIEFTRERGSHRY